MNEVVAGIESSGIVSNGACEAANHLIALSPTPLEKPKTASAAELNGIRCQFMTVTPELAHAWLTSNVKNRKLRDEVVKSYARDMVNGNWVITHQGVAFNDKHELIDGQHRLNAIVESGVPVMMLVTFGLPSNLLGKKLTTMD